MGTSKRGKASLLFEDPPLILSAASVVGKKEGEGPLGKYFDRIEMDSMLGKRTWEEAERSWRATTCLIFTRAPRSWRAISPSLIPSPVSYTHLDVYKRQAIFMEWGMII